MSKINYRVCDICGNILKTDIRFTGYVNGCRIWNKLFNRLDICDDCIGKIKRLSIDKKDEEKYIKEVAMEEIATCMKVPVNTVKTRIRKAKSILKQELEARGIDR